MQRAALGIAAGVLVCACSAGSGRTPAAIDDARDAARVRATPYARAELFADIENAAACGSGSDCASGFCADGVCCNSACDAQCEACNVTPQVGTCVPIVGAPQGDRGACAGSGTCAGTCDGVGSACSYPDDTAVCMSTCTGEIERQWTCDGSGACIEATASTSCGEYVCGSDGACNTSCTTDAACSNGYQCTQGACQPPILPGDCASDADCVAPEVCTDESCEPPSTGGGGCCAATDDNSGLWWLGGIGGWLLIRKTTARDQHVRRRFARR